MTKPSTQSEQPWIDATTGAIARASGMLPEANMPEMPAREVPINCGFLAVHGRRIEEEMVLRCTLSDAIACARIPHFRALARHHAAGRATTEPGWCFRCASGIPGQARVASFRRSRHAM